MHCSRILEASKFQFFANSARLCRSMFERALHTASSARNEDRSPRRLFFWPLPLPSPRISSPTRRCYKKAKFERAWRSRPRSRLQCRQVSCAWKPNGRAAPVCRKARRVGGFDSDPRRGMSKPRLKFNSRQRGRKQHFGDMANKLCRACASVHAASDRFDLSQNDHCWTRVGFRQRAFPWRAWPAHWVGVPSLSSSMSP